MRINRFCCRSLRKQRKQEYYDRERRKERERRLQEYQENVSAEKKKIDDASAEEANEKDTMETVIEQPSAEEIQQLAEDPKPLAQKKVE